MFEHLFECIGGQDSRPAHRKVARVPPDDPDLDPRVAGRDPPDS